MHSANNAKESGRVGETVEDKASISPEPQSPQKPQRPRSAASGPEQRHPLQCSGWEGGAEPGLERPGTEMPSWRHRSVAGQPGS